MVVGVTSEVGRLKRVLVHRPGDELLAVTPETKRNFLYDDLIDQNAAASEHRRFTAVLARFAEVVDVRQVLLETLSVDGARDFLTERAMEHTALGKFAVHTLALEADELVSRLVEGWSVSAGAFSDALGGSATVTPPLPNLFFTRDASMVVGDRVIISAMRHPSRWPEEIISRTIFGFHPDLKSDFIYDGSIERRPDYYIEGGDVHVLSPEVLLMGASERTSLSAIDELTQHVFDHQSFEHVIVVVMPKSDIAIHLDMIWTQLDSDLCAVFPPCFVGPAKLPVLHRARTQKFATTERDIFGALEKVGLPMEGIRCGGAIPRVQQREQWMSACNFVALAPGQVIAYERNGATLTEMQRAGFRVVRADDILSGGETLEEGVRTVVTVPGAELVRGGGGPRCMTCPIWREPVL